MNYLIISTHYQHIPQENPSFFLRAFAPLREPEITETPAQLEQKYRELNRRIFSTTDTEEMARLFEKRDRIQRIYPQLTGKTLEYVNR